MVVVVVVGGVLINNLIVLRVFLVFPSPCCFVWGGVGWGGIITSCYVDVPSVRSSCRLQLTLGDTGRHWER